MNWSLHFSITADIATCSYVLVVVYGVQPVINNHDVPTPERDNVIHGDSKVNETVHMKGVSLITSHVLSDVMVGI